MLSHLHADHFDDLVAEQIRKNLPIISTPHACKNLGENGHSSLHPLESWEKIHVKKDGTELTITSMPGNHAPSGPDVSPDIVMPPVMGSMISFKRGNAVYNMYISGDTLYYDELKVRQQNVNSITPVLAIIRYNFRKSTRSIHISNSPLFTSGVPPFL